MRDRLIELIDSADEECKHTKSCKKCSGYGKGSLCMVTHIADYLLENGVIILPYNLHLPKELYRHMFDNNKNKVVVKCKVGKNTGYGFTLIHYRDGREWEYKYTSIGKTVFLTKEEAEQALKGGA